MLNRHNAVNELKEAVRAFAPAWNDEMADSESVARGHHYITELLKILPDYSAVPAPALATDITSQVEALRRRLRNILASEQTLNLDPIFCNNAFNLQLILAKLFPFNKEITADDADQSLTEEMWEETFTLETLTRTTEDLIIFPQSAVLTRQSTQSYYDSNFGKDEQGNPRNFDNTPMSDREINSLQAQGITVQREILQDIADYAEELEYEDELELSVGKRIGKKLGTVLTQAAIVAMMFVSRSPMLFWPSALIGATAMGEKGLKGFVTGFTSTYMLGALANTVFALATWALNTEPDFNFGNPGMLALVLPVSVAVLAVRHVVNHGGNFSDALNSLSTKLIYEMPIKFAMKLGELIENGLAAIYQFLKNPLARTENTVPASPSSHAIMIQAMVDNPAVQLENVAVESVVNHEFSQPFLINAPVQDVDNNVDNLPSFRLSR